ncbi:MAG TPA: hypothetical protein PK397_06270 [Ignavibacteriaceae bacterium]|jgi:hypothetical protein|nr:hypothetical protein [Ignavibacteriaceae bacterium]
MEENKINELITALVDDELPDEKERESVLALVKENPEYSFSHDVQLITKRTVLKHKNLVTAPESLRRNIIRQIKPRVPFYQKVFNNLFDIKPPVYAYASVVVIIIISLFLITSNSNDEQFLNQNRNDFVLTAKNNFYSFMDGKINPDILTSDPALLKKFFKEKGIVYKTEVPCFKNWVLVGGVISSANGEKYAHMLYRNDEGKMIYVFQVCEKYLSKSSTLYVTKDIMDCVQARKFFSEKSGVTNTYLTKHHGNLFAIVTNDVSQSEENLISEFQ